MKLQKQLQAQEFTWVDFKVHWVAFASVDGT